MNVLACNESTKDKVTYTIDSYLRSTLPHLVLVISYDTFRLYVDRYSREHPQTLNFAFEYPQVPESATVQSTRHPNLRRSPFPPNT